MISIVRILGAPVIEPPGKATLRQSTELKHSANLPRMVVTNW
jgi:hypothetical protein